VAVRHKDEFYTATTNGGKNRVFYANSSGPVFVISFFRDPERDIPGDPDSIVSPADGKVIKVERLREERLLKDEALKVSIFMNIFDVHVNRTPVSGRVVNIIYNPGRFFSANLDKASFENEQNALLVEEARGRLVLNQIAGLVARRIVCRIREGTELRKGERIGMVMFGSRVDLYLPLNTNVIVKVGDRVKAGSSVLGYW
jgi:phosphatidylserine decarboxylase